MERDGGQAGKDERALDGDEIRDRAEIEMDGRIGELECPGDAQMAGGGGPASGGQPGMPAEVVIKTGGRSLLTYLAAPLFKRMAGSMKEE